MRRQPLDRGAHRRGRRHGRHAGLDARGAVRRHDVDAGAAGDQPDIDGDATVIVGHRFELENLAAHLGDRVAAVLVARAGVRGDAEGFEIVAGDTLAGCHDLAALARRLGHQHDLALPGQALDQRPRGRAADLLVAEEQVRHWKRRRLAALEEAAHGLEGDIGAALHVVDAGPERLVAGHPERHDRERALGVHGVEMTEDQDARPVVVPGRPHDQVIAIAVLARLALRRGAERAIGALDLGHHGLDPGEVGRVALDLDPGADALQDLGGAHRGTPSCSPRSNSSPAMIASASPARGCSRCSFGPCWQQPP